MTIIIVYRFDSKVTIIQKQPSRGIFNPNLGGFFRGSLWGEGGGGGKLPLLSKTWSKTCLQPDLKISFFLQKYTFTQSNSVRAALEIFQFCFDFL